MFRPMRGRRESQLVERIEVLENDRGRMNSMGLHGEGGVFQNAVGFGGGVNPSSARKRGTRERKGREGLCWEQL